MAKAKRETYASMRRRMEDLITRMEKEKAEVEAAMQKERVRTARVERSRVSDTTIPVGYSETRAHSTGP